MYKKIFQNNKWTYLLYDFDLDFGMASRRIEDYVNQSIDVLKKVILLKKII